MKVMQAVLLLLLTANGLVADEGKPPSYPVPGVDMVLTGGKSAKEFFAARAADTDCRKTLEEAKAAYRAEKDKLDTMTKEKASRDDLDEQERKVENSRYKLLVNMEECGPCATDEVKSVKVESAFRTEYWYVVDGSYQIEAKDEAQLKKKIKQLKQFLLTVPAKNDRLRNVIEYSLVDNETGKLLADRTIGRSPFYAFTSIGRPMLGSVFACDFYSKGVAETSPRQATELLVKTEIVPRPNTFTPPSGDYVSPSGAKYPTQHEIIRSGLSMTYLSSDGYLRMWNAVDYRADLDLARKMMRMAHLDILAQVDEMLQRDGPK